MNALHRLPLVPVSILLIATYANAFSAEASWKAIENDDATWTLQGPYEIPKEYEHSNPSGTVTALFGGSRMTVKFSGTRVAVYAQGGPYQCGDATIELDGKVVAREVAWPFLPVDRQAVWLSKTLPEGEHTLSIIADSEVAVDFIRVWSDKQLVPKDQLPVLPVYKKPSLPPAQPTLGKSSDPLEVQSGDFEHHLNVPIEDLPPDRQYVVHIPPKPVANMPLVLAIHGVDGTAEGMHEYSGFNAKADKAGFIVAYPESPNAWLSGRDHPYLLKVVEDVKKRYRINPNRVYATGHSAGGFMSHSLGMLYPDVFAAVASVAGGVPPAYFPYPERNRHAISVMEIHNQADSVVDFGGVTEAMRFWSRFNGCDQKPSVRQYNQVLTEEKRQRGDIEIILARFNDNSDDFGHHWPREKYYGFEAYDAIWEFFARHQLGTRRSQK